MEGEEGSRSRSKFARLVNKDGVINITYRTLLWSNPLTRIFEGSVRAYSSSFWLACFIYLIVWSFFGLCFYLLEFFNGTLCDGPGPYANCTSVMKDRNFGNLAPDLQEIYIDDLRCVTGVYNFQSALMFSVETLSTIGFGARAIKTGCTLATFLLMVESIIGIVLPTLWTAMIIAKFRNRSSQLTVRFSHRAAITIVNGKGRQGGVTGFEEKERKFLNIKVAAVDAIHGILLEASASGVFIRDVRGPEADTDTGENMQLIKFCIDHGRQETKFHVMWPIIISHEIDNKSPLYHFANGEPDSDNFELVVILKGSTSYDGGLVVQKTSYLPSEIVSVGKFNFENVFKERVDYIAINDQKKGFDEITNIRSEDPSEEFDIVDEL